MAPGPRAQPRQRDRAGSARARGRVGLTSLGLPLPAGVAVAALLALPGGGSTTDGVAIRQEQGLVALVGGRVTVLHATGDSARAQAYLDVLLGLPPLPGLPDSIPSEVRAYLAPDQATFDSLIGGRVPEWSAGVAIPARRMLVLPAWQGSLTGPGAARRVLAHEWAHLGLHQWLAPLRVPRWFSEGYAEWVGGWDATQAWRLRVLLAVGRAPPLDSLTLRWPGDRASAEAAYLLAATVIEYLVEESGERGLSVLLRTWRDGGSFEDALRSTYGLTSGQLEEDWRAWAEDRYGWLYVLSHSAVFWLLLALGLLVMARVRRRRNRDRLAQLRAQEPPERPAYWMGDEEG